MSRPKATMNEVMGSAGGQKTGRTPTLESLPELLGEKMPRLPLNKVGKVRLLQALKNRFGDGYRNLPGVLGILEDFDLRVEHSNRVEKMKRIKL